jgi:glycerol uptake facilitator-like aquaporin
VTDDQHAAPANAAPRPGGGSGERGAELRRLTAELLGTASLLAAIVGSGIVVAQGGDAPAQLFQHAVVVGVTLTALILAFGPVSGAHLNPVVTLADAWFGGLPWPRAARYVAAQLTGAVLGTAFTNATFGVPAVALASTARPGVAMAAAEGAATAGLLVVIFGLVRTGAGRLVAGAVGAYITGAIVFTASDAFANPAVTVARMLTDTWTGIAPVSVPAFLIGQGAGLAAGIALIAWLYRPRAEHAARVVVPADLDRPTPDHHRRTA